jgi:hypothetical protein
MPAKRDPKLARAGVSAYNKPKRTPNHKTKSHVVVAKSGGQTKTIRFGQQGVRGAGANPTSAKQKRVRNPTTPDTTLKTLNHLKCRLDIGRIKRNGDLWLNEDSTRISMPNVSA